MVKAKIILDDRHVCSAHLKEDALHLSVRNFPKLLMSPRFVKLALSLKAATTVQKSTDTGVNASEKPLDIKFDTGFIKSIFSR